MASRSRTSTPVQYEDFLPKYEWKEETGSHILVLYLPPEFKKEQIRITYVQSTRMIRVNGERPLVNNKWSRFNQGFPLPQNCDVNKIEARYQNGVLTMTMPKTKPPTTPQPQPPIATVQETKPPQQVTPPPPPPPPPKGPASTAVRKQTDEKTTATKKPAPEPIPQKGVESSSSLERLMKDQTTKKDQDGTTETSAPPKDTIKRKGDAVLPQEDESRRKRKEQVVVESSADKESSKKRKESMSEIKTDAFKRENGEDKATEEFIAGKVKLVKGLAKAAKRNIQEFSMEVNEDRQAMVNIGVAVLVVVALGTYIYYSRGSSRTSK